MEAAVNLVNVDLKKNLANGELHLRRVHKIVLRLELLNKQKLATGPRGRACTPLPCQLGSTRAPEDRIQYLKTHYEPLVLDEVELLDLDATGFSDHETWLYVPPQTKKNSQDPVTPLQWCRHVLEAPEWKVARRFMRLQLESASCWRQLPSTPPPLGKVAVVSPIGSPRSPENHGNPHANSQNPSGRARTPTFIPHLTRGSNSSPRRRSSPRLQTDLAVIPPGPDEDDLVPRGYKLKDLTDVQVVARLQEEKLRQACASTSSALATRRSRSVTLPLSARPDPEDKAGGKDHLYPQHAPTFSSDRNLQSSSFLSVCPSAPPRLSAGRLRQPFRTGPDKTQTSLPYLARAQSVPNASLLATNQNFGSPTCLSSPASPTLQHARIQSTGRTSSPSRQPPKASAYVSPTISASRSPGGADGTSRIPLRSKCSSYCMSGLSPPWPANSCKMVQPGHSSRNAMRLFST
ncbi:SLAIN motif-containing protein 1 [Syngnathus scovelli]|uniref:SLAIN motif-containing protein 1 n=1 Tax=Syngnathus scovelli TaxID=161590 RepID=UPI002110C87F|nr:SLAIN motif-containing protein 1 [Syngnathus scovelli]